MVKRSQQCSVCRCVRVQYDGRISLWNAMLKICSPSAGSFSGSAASHLLQADPDRRPRLKFYDRSGQGACSA